MLKIRNLQPAAATQLPGFFSPDRKPRKDTLFHELKACIEKSFTSHARPLAEQTPLRLAPQSTLDDASTPTKTFTRLAMGKKPSIERFRTMWPASPREPQLYSSPTKLSIISPRNHNNGPSPRLCEADSKPLS